MSDKDATSLNKIVKNVSGKGDGDQSDDIDERSSGSSRVRNPNFMKGSREPFMPPPRH